MNQVLTREEMEAKFRDEWVLIADPEVDESLNVVRGRVVCHSAERAAVDQIAITMRLKASATLYTGEWPDDMDYML